MPTLSEFNPHNAILEWLKSKKIHNKVYYNATNKIKYKSLLIENQNI